MMICIPHDPILWPNSCHYRFVLRPTGVWLAEWLFCKRDFARRQVRAAALAQSCRARQLAGLLIVGWLADTINRAPLEPLHLRFDYFQS